LSEESSLVTPPRWDDLSYLSDFSGVWQNEKAGDSRFRSTNRLAWLTPLAGA
jgi:hypothetical protein